jgi:hypothetical protein
MEETIDAFKWTFHNFLAVMGAKCPQTILTGESLWWLSYLTFPVHFFPV